MCLSYENYFELNSSLPGIQVKFHKRKTTMDQTSENILWVISEILQIFNLLSYIFEVSKFHDEPLQ